MESKIMQIFYGADCLPYKDQERVVHYPIVGQAFQGASQTTEIHFYIDRIGGNNATWVATAKLPNGKIGSKILDIEEDTELNENYVVLPLSSFYTQAQGNLFISLQGYDGGVEVEYDDETEIYSILGTPVIQATGSIKIAINYATQFIGSGEEENVTLQLILANLGTKLNITNGIVVYNGTIDTSNYEEGQMFYNKANNYIYKLVSGELVEQKVYVKLSTENDVVYGTDENGDPTTIPYGVNVDVDMLPLRDGDGQIKVPTNPLNDHDATSRQYVNTLPRLALHVLDESDQLEDLPSECLLAYNGKWYLFQKKSVGEDIVDVIFTCETGYYKADGIDFGEYAKDIITSTYYHGYVMQTTDGNKVYGTDSQGNQKTFTVDNTVGADGNIVRRASGTGQIMVPLTPSQNGNASSKKYVDDSIASAMTSALVYRGSKTVAEINALNTSTLKVGDFYNVTDSGVITLGTLEVLAGDNICWTGTGWDKLTMDLSAYDDKFIAAGFFEVQEYNQNTGEITMVYASDLYDMSYTESTGILTIEAN